MTRRLDIVSLMCGVVLAVSSRGEMQPAVTPEALRDDWLLQDGAGKELLSSGKHAECAALVRSVLDDLSPRDPALEQSWTRLQKSMPSPSEWAGAYITACEARRRRRLRPLLGKWRTIVFIKARTVRASFFAYTEGQSDAQHESHFLPGCTLCLLHLDDAEGRVEVLIDDPKGALRDPAVSYEGRKLLFAWKRSKKEDDYHLYEMDTDSRRIRQLTFGLGVADYEGEYLPNGDIVFASSRCVQTTDCWWTEVSNLYVCDGEGRYLRRFGFDQVATVSPSVLNDGRIVYTRWDYNDRGQVYPQPLFCMHPDGTAQMEYYGNSSWFPTTLTHARAIPDSSKVVAVATGHHSWQPGKMCLVDVAKGRQEDEGIQLIAPVREVERKRVDSYGQWGDRFQHPYPLDERHFVVSYATDGGKGPRGRGVGDRFGLYFMDADGNRELLAWDPKISCNYPVPLAPRPRPPLRPSSVDYRQKTGIYTVQDIYAGPGLAGVERGSIERLRVVALEYRAAGVGSNRNGGPAGGALVSTPIAVGNGAWDVKRVLGEASVYADGSAAFTVPARTPLYFQAIDRDGHVAQTMRSWSTLQPGETFSCVGCHEDKNEAPPQLPASTEALRRGPEALVPFYGPARGFSYTREVQPILDRHCVRCHGPKHKLDLRGEPVEDRGSKRRWLLSYVNLTGAKGKDRHSGNPNGPYVKWPGSQSAPPMLKPYAAGSATSPMLAQLRKGHNKVRLSPEEYDKLACWIDLGVPFCADYWEANTWNDGEKAKYDRYEQKRHRLAAEVEDNIRKWVVCRETGKHAPSPAKPMDGERVRPRE